MVVSARAGHPNGLAILVDSAPPMTWPNWLAPPAPLFGPPSPGVPMSVKSPSYQDGVLFAISGGVQTKYQARIVHGIRLAERVTPGPRSLTV